MSSVHCKIKTLIISRRPGSLPPRSNERAILFREEGAGEGGWVGGETHFRSLRRVHETGLSKIRPQASSCLSTFLPWKRVPGIAYPSHLSLNLLLGPQTYQDLLHLLCVTPWEPFLEGTSAVHLHHRLTSLWPQAKQSRGCKGWMKDVEVWVVMIAVLIQCWCSNLIIRKYL